VFEQRSEFPTVLELDGRVMHLWLFFELFVASFLFLFSLLSIGGAD
jgi:hypothetical protein